MQYSTASVMAVQDPFARPRELDRYQIAAIVDYWRDLELDETTIGPFLTRQIMNGYGLAASIAASVVAGAGVLWSLQR